MVRFELICDDKMQILHGHDVDHVDELVTVDDREHVRRWWKDPARPALARLADGTWVAFECTDRTGAQAHVTVQELDATTIAAHVLGAWDTQPHPAAILDETGLILAANAAFVSQYELRSGDRADTNTISELTGHPIEGTSFLHLTPASKMTPRPGYWDMVPAPMLVTTLDGQIVLANAAGGKLFKGARTPQKVTRLAPADEAARLTALLHAAAVSEHPQQADLIMDLDGSPRWTSVLVMPTKVDLALVVLVSDLDGLPTARSDHRLPTPLRAVIDHSPIPTVVTTRTSRLVHVNQAMMDFTGPVPSSMLGADVSLFIHPDAKADFTRTLATVSSASGAVLDLASSEKVSPRRAGTLWIAATGDSYHPDELIVIQLTSLGSSGRFIDSRSFAEVRYKERRQFAQSLHDDVIGPVAAARLALETGKMPIRSVVEILKEAEQAARFTQDDIDPHVDRRGLDEAIRAAIERARVRFEHRAVDVTVETDAQASTLPTELQAGVVAIVSQAVQNAFKHTNATAVSVIVEITGETLRITVADNGEGFPAENPTLDDLLYPGHLGLLSMNSNAQLFNGRMWIRNRKIGGAAIEVEIPLVGVSDPGAG